MLHLIRQGAADEFAKISEEVGQATVIRRKKAPGAIQQLFDPQPKAEAGVGKETAPGGFSTPGTTTTSHRPTPKVTPRFPGAEQKIQGMEKKVLEQIPKLSPAYQMTKRVPEFFQKAEGARELVKNTARSAFKQTPVGKFVEGEGGVKSIGKQILNTDPKLLKQQVLRDYQGAQEAAAPFIGKTVGKWF